MKIIVTVDYGTLQASYKAEIKDDDGIVYASGYSSTASTGVAASASGAVKRALAHFASKLEDAQRHAKLAGLV